MSPNQIRKLLAGLIIAGCTQQSIANDPFDFSYRVIGATSIRPALVFNDGRDVFIQPGSDDNIRVVGAKSARQGPYIVVFGLIEEFALVNQRQERVTVIHDVRGTPAESAPPLSEMPEQTALVTPVTTSSLVPADTGTKDEKTNSSESKASAITEIAVSAKECNPTRVRASSMLAVSFAAGARGLSAAAAQQAASAASQPDVSAINVTMPSNWSGAISTHRENSLRAIFRDAGIPNDQIKFIRGMTFDDFAEIESVTTREIPCSTDKPVVTANGDRVTVMANQANADQVLRELANELRRRFVIEGQPKPMSVSVNLVSEPHVEVLRHIGAQINPYAQIVLRDRELVLRYR